MEPEITQQAAELAQRDQENQLGPDQARENPNALLEVFGGHVEIEAQLEGEPERSQQADRVSNQQVGLAEDFAEMSFRHGGGRKTSGGWGMQTESSVGKRRDLN